MDSATMLQASDDALAMARHVLPGWLGWAGPALWIGTVGLFGFVMAALLRWRVSRRFPWSEDLHRTEQAHVSVLSRSTSTCVLVLTLYVGFMRLGGWMGPLVVLPGWLCVVWVCIAGVTGVVLGTRVGSHVHPRLRSSWKQGVPNLFLLRLGSVSKVGGLRTMWPLWVITLVLMDGVQEIRSEERAAMWSGDGNLYHALLLTGGEPEMLIEAANRFGGDSQPDVAEVLARAAVAAAPDDAGIRLDAAWVFADEHEDGQASAFAAEIVLPDQEPAGDRFWLLADLTDLLLTLGDDDTARERYQDMQRVAEEIEPDPYALTRMAFTGISLGETSMVRERVEQAGVLVVRDDKSDPWLMFDLGSLYLQLRDDIQADRWFGDAKRQARDMGDVELKNIEDALAEIAEGQLRVNRSRESWPPSPRQLPSREH